MLVTALVIMQLPVSEADAAASASDFRIEGGTLVKYRGTEKNVSVPDTVDTIGRGAFEDNTNIELVVLPNSVKNIEPYAFWGCNNLDTVVLGKGLTSVGDYAFAGCKGLVQMTIPANVTSIGVQAFGDCVNLADISIPPETGYIQETAFDGCARLTIHCDPGSAADQFAQSFYERQKEIPEYEDVPNYDPSVPTVPDTKEPTPEPAETPTPSETPAEQPGEELGSTHVVANTAVVFVDNSQLQVYGGEPEKQPETAAASVEEVLGSLENGTVPKYAVVDGKVVADQAYYRNEELGGVALPEGVEEIGQFSFARSSLTSVIVPQGVKKIGYGAFYHCNELGDVMLPDTVMCVEPKAFEHSLWVERFLEGTDNDEAFLIEGGVLIAYRGNAKEVIVPEGVRVIAGEVFLGHDEIESVTLPESLLVIGEGAFENCCGLSRIIFGSNVEEIKDRAFKGSAVSEISVPASVKKLGLQAFGSAIRTYEFGEPEYTHETSAERLSNQEYRVYDGAGAQEPGVTVNGPEGAAASLEGANRSYTLAVTVPEDVSDMESAFQRSFRRGLPEETTVYELTLTDSSGIPLTKLGNQALTVVIPVPEALKGRNLTLFTLDRNGQLEILPAERVSLEGAEAIRFKTNHLSLFAVYAAGEADAGEELLEVGTEFTSMSQGPETLDSSRSFRKNLQWLGGGFCLLTGGILILTGIGRK